MMRRLIARLRRHHLDGLDCWCVPRWQRAHLGRLGGPGE